LEELDRELDIRSEKLDEIFNSIIGVGQLIDLKSRSGRFFSISDIIRRGSINPTTAVYRHALDLQSLVDDIDYSSHTLSSTFRRHYEDFLLDEISSLVDGPLNRLLWDYNPSRTVVGSDDGLAYTLSQFPLKANELVGGATVVTARDSRLIACSTDQPFVIEPVDSFVGSDYSMVIEINSTSGIDITLSVVNGLFPVESKIIVHDYDLDGDTQVSSTNPGDQDIDLLAVEGYYRVYCNLVGGQKLLVDPSALFDGIIRCIHLSGEFDESDRSLANWIWLRNDISALGRYQDVGIGLGLLDVGAGDIDMWEYVLERQNVLGSTYYNFNMWSKMDLTMFDAWYDIASKLPGRSEFMRWYSHFYDLLVLKVTQAKISPSFLDRIKDEITI
jgi:hypothetical protein